VIPALVVAAPVAPATLPDGWLWDDGYTLFNAVNKPTTAKGKRTSHWYLQAALRCFGSAPAYSTFKLVVEKNGKTVATGQREAQRLAGSEPFLITLALETAQELPGPGLYTVKIFVIDGDTKTEHLARTHTIDIGAVRFGDQTELVVSRHGEVLDSILYLRGPRYPTYHQRGRGAVQTQRSVELSFWLSPTVDSAFHQGRCKLTVDGKTVMTELNGILQDQTPAEVALNQLWRYSPSEYLRFQQVSLILPLDWSHVPSPQKSPFVNLSDHPGKWEIAYSVEGKLVRSWRFTVNPDGTIAPHPEQAAGLSLAKNAYFVETVIPTGGSAFDARLVPTAATRGGFYGLPWKTSEGKALAPSLPTKGTAWPGGTETTRKREK
jgi:hypothetical protein